MASDRGMGARKMASAEERRANADIARNLKSISEELHETNRLFSEFLKLQLRHEDSRKGSPKNDDVD
jgi:hypothetical protein